MSETIKRGRIGQRDCLPPPGLGVVDDGASGAGLEVPLDGRPPTDLVAGGGTSSSRLSRSISYCHRW